jgi:outer membrane protein TolC
VSTGNNFFQDALDVVTNTLSGNYGLLGYDTKTGKMKAGALGKVLMDGTKEITGANAAEEANDMARKQYEDSVVKARQDRENMVAQNERKQIQLSNNAPSVSNKGSKINQSKGAPLVGDTSDFLGL